jgi:hypothetical protein
VSFTNKLQAAARLILADWYALLALANGKMMAPVAERPSTLQLLQDASYAKMRGVETAKLLLSEVATKLGHVRLNAAAAAGDKGDAGASDPRLALFLERIGSCRGFGSARRLGFSVCPTP